MKALYRILILSSTLFISIQSSAQLDSLKQIIDATSSTSENRLSAYHDYIQNGYLFSKPDTAIFLIQSYLELAESEGSSYEIGRALHQYGTSYAVRGMLDSCEVFFRQALPHHTKANNKLGLAKTSYNLGNVIYTAGKIDSSIVLFNSSMKLYEELEIWSKLERGAYAIGRIHLNQGEYLKALEQFDKGLDIINTYKSDGELAKLLIIKADALKALGEIPEAMRNYELALDFSEKKGDTQNQAHTLNRISSINTLIGEYDKAIEISKRAISLSDQASDITIFDTSYSSLANALAGKGEYEESTAILEKSLELAIQNNNVKSKGIYFSGIGENHLALGNLMEAKHFFNQAISNYENIDYSGGICKVKSFLAEIEHKNGFLNKAINLANQSLAIATEIKTTDYQINAASQLVKLYKASGNKSKALELLEMSNSLKEKIKEEENQRAVIKQQFNYDYTKKNLRDSLNFQSEKLILNERNLAQKKNLNRTLWALAIISALAFLSFWQYRKIGKQKGVITKSLSEKEVLLKEIHHRVKNNLQVVSSLLGWQTKTTKDTESIQALKEGQSRVQSMSLIHQNLYSEDDLTGINMQEYIENLCTNLYNTYTIDKDRIKLELGIDELNLDVDDVVPIGLIINELITNSLKYAFPNENSGTISISLKRVNEKLKLTVEDDGIGIEDLEGSKNKKSLGFGLVNAFSDKLRADLDIASSGKGTQISMIFASST